jgi:hypothetical protein
MAILDSFSKWCSDVVAADEASSLSLILRGRPYPCLMKSNDWWTMCELARMRVLVLDRNVSSEPDHLAWSRLGTLLRCLVQLKGTPEGAVAGVGLRAVRINQCTPF